MIISFRDFRDEEYFIPKEIFEKNGKEVSTLSTQKGIALGSQGGEAEVDGEIKDLNVEDFDVFVFVGGQGSLKELDNNDSYEIVQEAFSKGKLIGAICISPVILANSGILSGKESTVWSSGLKKEGIKILKENNAIYKKEAVVVDGNIITANGPQSAEEFANVIVKNT